jgi:hypothetical protein
LPPPSAAAVAPPSAAVRCRLVPLGEVNLQDQDGGNNEGDRDSVARGGVGEGRGGAGERKRKELQITSPAVFDQLMAVCLVHCHEEFCCYLLLTGEGANKDDNDGGNDDNDDKDHHHRHCPLHC